MTVPRPLFGNSFSLLQFSTTEGYLLSILQLSYLKIRVTKIKLDLLANTVACHTGCILTCFSLCCFNTSIHVIVANSVQLLLSRCLHYRNHHNCWYNIQAGCISHYCKSYWSPCESQLITETSQLVEAIWYPSYWIFKDII